MSVCSRSSSSSPSSSTVVLFNCQTSLYFSWSTFVFLLYSHLISSCLLRSFRALKQNWQFKAILVSLFKTRIHSSLSLAELENEMYGELKRKKFYYVRFRHFTLIRSGDHLTVKWTRFNFKKLTQEREKKMCESRTQRNKQQQRNSQCQKSRHCFCLLCIFWCNNQRTMNKKKSHTFLLIYLCLKI